MKIAITGANGFVGAALCRYFYKAGHEIIALGNSSPNQNLLKVASYVKVDISKVMPEIQADVCIHTAALPSDTDTYKSLIISNVEGTLNVIEAARNCSHLIHISSSSVYQFKDEPVSEDEANIGLKLSDYGETKLLAEDIMDLDIPGNQSRLILRPRAIYGVGDRMLLPRILRLIRGDYFLCPLKRNIRTSLTHIDNVAYAIDLFLAHKSSPPFQIFNVTDDKPYLLREQILELANTIAKHKLKVIPIPTSFLDIIFYLNSKTELIKDISKPVLNSLNRNTILDISRIKKELNYAPIKSFNDSYSEIANWIDSFGGSKNYLKQLSDAPWRVPL